MSTRVGLEWFGEGVWFKWDKANSTPLELGLGLSLKISGPFFTTNISMLGKLVIIISSNTLPPQTRHANNSKPTGHLIP